MDASLDVLVGEASDKDAVRKDPRYVSWPDLDLEHLPEVIRSSGNLKVIKDIGKRVVLLTVKISEDRKKEDAPFKEETGINGSGFALWYNDNEVVVSTNKHVLWNEEEVRNAEVCFFFEEPRPNYHVKSVLLPAGSGMRIIKTKKDDDFTLALFKVEPTLRKKFAYALDSYGPIPDLVHRIKLKSRKGRKAVVCLISHPQALRKRVSFGNVLQIDDGDGNMRHTTATAVGSSGGVMILFCPLNSSIPTHSIWYHVGKIKEEKVPYGRMQINNEDLFTGPKLEQLLHQQQADSHDEMTDNDDKPSSEEKETMEICYQTENELYSWIAIVCGLLISHPEVNTREGTPLKDCHRIKMKANALNIVLDLSQRRILSESEAYECLGTLLTAIDDHKYCTCSALLTEDTVLNVLPNFICPEEDEESSAVSTEEAAKAAPRPKFCFLERMLTKLSSFLSSKPGNCSLYKSRILPMIRALSAASSLLIKATQHSDTTAKDGMESSLSTQTSAKRQAAYRRSASSQTTCPGSSCKREEQTEQDRGPYENDNLLEQRKVFSEALSVVEKSMPSALRLEAQGLSIVKPVHEILHYHYGHLLSKCNAFLLEKQEGCLPEMKIIQELVTQLSEAVRVIQSLQMTGNDPQHTFNDEHADKAESCSGNPCNFSTQPTCGCPRPTSREFGEKFHQSQAIDEALFREQQMLFHIRSDYICKPQSKDETGKGRGSRSCTSSDTVGGTVATAHSTRPPIVEKAKTLLNATVLDTVGVLEAVMRGDTSSKLIDDLTSMTHLWNQARKSETEYLRACHNTYTFLLRVETVAEGLMGREMQIAVETSEASESMAQQPHEQESSLNSQQGVFTASSEACTSASAPSTNRSLHRSLGSLIPLPAPKEEEKLRGIILRNPDITPANICYSISTEWPDAPESIRVITEMAGGFAVKQLTERLLKSPRNLDDADFIAQFSHHRFLRQVEDALNWLNNNANKEAEDRKRLKKRIRRAQKRKTKTNQKRTDQI